MTKDKKSPYYPPDYLHAKPLNMKEWAIKQIKKGISPNKVARDIKRLFGEYVSMQTVYRWRHRYIEVTGEQIPTFFEINKTVEQKKKNRAKMWQTKEVKK